MTKRLRRSEDDDRTARPFHSSLRYHRDRQRELALQKPRLTHCKPLARYSASPRRARSRLVRHTASSDATSTLLNSAVQRGQCWAPIRGQSQSSTPIDTQVRRTDVACASSPRDLRFGRSMSQTGFPSWLVPLRPWGHKTRAYMMTRSRPAPVGLQDFPASHAGNIPNFEKTGQFSRRCSNRACGIRARPRHPQLGRQRSAPPKRTTAARHRLCPRKSLARCCAPD